jgi:phospholipase D1/2
MAGEPFKVGRFAHTLRVRLMREHLGVNVDALSDDDLMEAKSLNPESPQTVWDPNAEQEFGRVGVTRAKATHRYHAGGLVQLATEGRGSSFAFLSLIS